MKFNIVENGVLFMVFQIVLLIMSLLSESRIISIFLLSYFYYSTFTGWHESVHREKNFNKPITFNKLMGVISISPLIIFNFNEKMHQHLLHHGFTNNPFKDPDYNANNLIFKNLFTRKKYITRDKYLNELTFIEFVFKLFFIFYIFLWTSSDKSFSDFLLAFFLGNFFMHLLVNLIPHFRNNSKYGRDIGGNKIVNIILLGNNYHGTHHKYPDISWLGLI